METTLKQLLSIPLSMSDVKNLVPGVPVFEYAKFRKMKRLPPVCIYLFLTSEQFGHWCCVFNRGDSIELFDSYGIPADSEYKFVNPEVLAHLGERDDEILTIAEKNKQSVIHNTFPLQKWGAEVETCGRHVVVRVLNKEKTMEQYGKWLQAIAKGSRTTPDYVVCFITSSK